jgi:serine/threonine protein kinase
MRPDLPTDPERWRRIEALLDEAFERPAGERRAFLDEACAGDPELRAQMEALLAADEKAGSFLATPAHKAAAALLADTSGEAARFTDRKLGPYRLIREIGAGGMGVVYEAEDTRLRRRVAIKLLPPEYSRDRAAKERFLREARAASALDHPNICTVHDIGDSEGQLYIVMACYEGETLKERLERGPLPVDEARQVAIQVARGLARAHEAGIIHRDIKSANVMLTRRGEAKILDFGIAKMRSDTSLTRTGSSPGTPAYMSPEQAQGKPVDARTDLWSLGVLLYEMLAGRRPFEGDDEQAILYAIQSREPEPLGRVRPEVPRALAGAVAKALAKNAAERSQSAADLLADLEAGRASAVPYRSKLRRLSASWAWILAAAATLALVALAGWWFFLRVPTIRVAILAPTMTVSAPDPEFESVAADVVEAAAGTLASLQGVQPLDPPYRDEKPGSNAEQQRAAEADEVLRPILDCRKDGCQVILRRLRRPRGAFLGTIGPFWVPTGIDNAYRLAEGVATYLQQLYKGHHAQPDSVSARVRPRDYATFVAIERKSDRGERFGTEDLDRLDGILRTSPDLLSAYLLAAGIARRLPDPDRAMGYAEQAHKLAPFDPRPLVERLRVEIAGRRLDDARATLTQLTDLAPNDVRVQTAEAELLEAGEKLEEARRLRENLVLRRPTWRQILGLAILEARLNDIETARTHLLNLLEAQPNNLYVLEVLAGLEAQSGDLHKAARLYERMAQIRPERFFFSNLGQVRYYLGDAAGAVVAYRRALEFDPGDLPTRFSLAAAQEALGHRSEAQAAYRSLLKNFEAFKGQPDAGTRMLQAQCLARLGKRAEATRLTEEVLGQGTEEVQILQQAAQVYALLGERHYAFTYIDRCLKKGMRREWFMIREFSSLATDPEFQKLLETPVPASRKPGPV